MSDEDSLSPDELRSKVESLEEELEETRRKLGFFREFYQKRRQEAKMFLERFDDHETVLKLMMGD